MLKKKIRTPDSVSKAELKQKIESAKEHLGELQRQYREAGIPVILVFEGMGAAGKGVQINRLIQALDPRGFSVYTGTRPTEEEQLRPFLWRYWVRTPAKGRIAVFDRSWYRMVQTDRFEKEENQKIINSKEINEHYEDINSFEKQLADDGAVIIKFFLHIDKKEQKTRFKKLLADPETAWRVTKEDQHRNREFEKFEKINGEMIAATDQHYAPWTIVDGTKKQEAAAHIIGTVCQQLENFLERRNQKTALKQPEPAPYSMGTNILSRIDLTKSLTEEEYQKEKEVLQKRLEFLHSELYHHRIPLIIGFEGWDAGGKGGAIKRLTNRLDPRGYQVIPTAAPSDVEKEHHYLWRFWEHMPKAGHIAIFDRTWYGRVMVERVEGFCSMEEWKRAYREINAMELHLANAGAVVLKFWMHIDKDEQEKRFTERTNNPLKAWKITEEDWRNREKWDLYKAAVNEMLVKTSTDYAPWIVVEGNDKYYARIRVLRSVVEALEAESTLAISERKRS
ncbi:polyphosphate:AMP phosphotransferase [Clostridia bacterium]|nr:polyphosphate:AMP phosphotransferase [Clostridia bacterium]